MPDFLKLPRSDFSELVSHVVGLASDDRPPLLPTPGSVRWFRWGSVSDQDGECALVRSRSGRLRVELRVGRHLEREEIRSLSTQSLVAGFKGEARVEVMPEMVDQWSRFQPGAGTVHVYATTAAHATWTLLPTKVGCWLLPQHNRVVATLGNLSVHTSYANESGPYRFKSNGAGTVLRSADTDIFVVNADGESSAACYVVATTKHERGEGRIEDCLTVASLVFGVRLERHIAFGFDDLRQVASVLERWPRGAPRDAAIRFAPVPLWPLDRRPFALWPARFFAMIMEAGRGEVPGALKAVVRAYLSAVEESEAPFVALKLGLALKLAESLGADADATKSLDGAVAASDLLTRDGGASSVEEFDVIEQLRRAVVEAVARWSNYEGPRAVYSVDSDGYQLSVTEPPYVAVPAESFVVATAFRAHVDPDVWPTIEVPRVPDLPMFSALREFAEALQLRTRGRLVAFLRAEAFVSDASDSRVSFVVHPRGREDAQAVLFSVAVGEGALRIVGAPTGETRLRSVEAVRAFAAKLAGHNDTVRLLQSMLVLLHERESGE